MQVSASAVELKISARRKVEILVIIDKLRSKIEFWTNTILVHGDHGKSKNQVNILMNSTQSSGLLESIQSRKFATHEPIIKSGKRSPQNPKSMNPRIRIKLITFISLSLITLLSTASLAQQRGGGGGGGGRGPQQDPTAPYINQMKLEGKDKAAFKKAFTANSRRVEKWASKVRTFRNKNKKYIGKPLTEIDPAAIEKMKADRAELDALQIANGKTYEEALAAFLSPEQIKQVGAIGKRVAEQRARAQARRAAGGQGGGGGR